MADRLPTRLLGGTGLELAILGFGGYHLVEASLADACALLNRYLDTGGNYVETAASYGNGASEAKIGRAIGHRRGDFYLASKTTEREAQGARAELTASLERLQTEYLDVWFMHSVSTKADLARLLAPGGALEAACEAQADGRVRFIGITAHGATEALEAAVETGRFAVLMTGFNYYDRFNFPAAENRLLPRANQLGLGVLAMKPLADGLLHRSAAAAFSYTWSLPVAAAVSGINTIDQLEADLGLARGFVPLTAAQRDNLWREAPELGCYVCRQCGGCEPCANGVPIQRVFELEGRYDRQMRDGRIRDAAEYGMRERLRFWFGGQEAARDDYAAAGWPARACQACGRCEELCPYGLTVRRKLDLADYKLSRDRLVF